jgi:hypothetical protein
MNMGPEKPHTYLQPLFLSENTSDTHLRCRCLPSALGATPGSGDRTERDEFGAKTGTGLRGGPAGQLPGRHPIRGAKT